MLQSTLPEVLISISLTEPVVVLSVSDGIDQLLGYKPEDFLSGNVSFRQLIHSEDQDIAESLFSSDDLIQTTSQTADFNIRLRQANGRIRCVKGHFTKKLAASAVTLDILLQDAKSLYQTHQPVVPNFKAMLENTHDYLYCKDRNHVFTSASHALIAITDPAEHCTDLLGQTDYDVFTEEYADIDYRLDKQVFAGIPIAHAVQEFQDSAGNKSWIDNRKYPIKNACGEIIGLFGFACDITESYTRQQRIEQLLTEQNAILDNSVAGIFTVKGRVILWANAADETILGYSKHELIGMPTRQLYVHQSDYDAVGAIYTNINPDKAVRYQSEFLCQDGKHIWVDLHGTLLNKAEGLSLWMLVDITERKRAELLLSDSEKQLNFVLEGSNLGFGDWDIPSNKVQRNHIWAEMLGYTFEEIQLTPQQWTDFVHPDDVQNAWKSIQDNLDGRASVHEMTYRMRTKSGDYKWILDRAKVVQRDTAGIAIRMAGTHTDVTQQKIAENNLRIAATAFDSHEGMIVTDIDGNILRVNPAFTSLTGYAAEEVVGKNPRLLRSGRQTDEFYIAMWQSLIGTGKWNGEVWNKRKSGEIYPEHLTITAVTNAEGVITNYVGSFVDITERVRLQKELKNQAEKDFLTGLTNRRHFLELAEAELVRAQRYSSSLSVLMMDIDFFKNINDTHGHKAGDLVLQKLALVCQEVLREVDIIGRLGGEEFSILLPETASPRAMEVAERLRQALESTSVQVEGSGIVLRFTVSIGVTAMIDANATVDSLLQKADIALYQAKAFGRNRVVGNFIRPIECL